MPVKIWVRWDNTREPEGKQKVRSYCFTWLRHSKCERLDKNKCERPHIDGAEKNRQDCSAGPPFCFSLLAQRARGHPAWQPPPGCQGARSAGGFWGQMGVGAGRPYPKSIPVCRPPPGREDGRTALQI